MQITSANAIFTTKQWTLKGLQIASHAIGDQANKIVLDTYEKTIRRWNEIYAREIRDGQRLHGQDLRFRVEHAQIVRKEDIERFAKLNIIPAVQPTHCTSDMSYAEARLGRQRAQDGAYIWQGFLKAGVKYLPLGSDFPVEHMNPFLGIYAAVTRKNVNGTSVGCLRAS
jgi:predicted amidohydrolase YtcJ